MTSPSLTRLILYTKRMDEMVHFYQTYFGFSVRQLEGDRIIELIPVAEGARLLLHPASKAAKEGQAAVKIVFDVPDATQFVEEAREKGLAFGPVHQADGYQFANTKDPSKNSVSISSRAYLAEGE